MRKTAQSDYHYVATVVQSLKCHRQCVSHCSAASHIRQQMLHNKSVAQLST